MAPGTPDQHRTELWFGRGSQHCAGEKGPMETEYAGHFHGKGKTLSQTKQVESLPPTHRTGRLR